MSDSLPPLAFLGAGSMGGAILRGVVASGIAVEAFAGEPRIFATNRTRVKAAELTGLVGVDSIALEAEPGGNARAAASARVVLVGVKPAMVPDLLRDIAPHLRADAMVISLAVGVPLQTFRSVLGEGVTVFRAMPNTPSLVGSGVTGLAPGPNATSEEVSIARRLFERVGAVIEVSEEQIDEVSAISGSGPAYVFLLIEELTRVAIDMGFREADARVMVQGTFRGAADLLGATPADPAELRRRVTSPKGTTERAIAVLQRAELGGLFREATSAALVRARELAAENRL
ncbi:pyrroline-5-carboxylate reductase [Microbacterium paludicola]|uniref:Pyrroline-5-carboxylate reductase n=1 Tax=Microbacterium paludicola TaxID=300019 RepID=A0A4Y9FT05_9MICO|nr:pyrroline-5-carboxylate reductase [Microbacterium paludicola]MBF0817275.1 pyrroline-5-carboxylate reductase [Microbacterium paludicola]TFU31982.1 pyrroline-5-carboxylate reductase [Microbacterium paludicola]